MFDYNRTLAASYHRHVREAKWACPGARDFLNKSPCARAVWALFATVYESRCGGLTVPGVAGLLHPRYAAGTVQHAVTMLHRLGLLWKTPTYLKTRRNGRARVYVKAGPPMFPRHKSPTSCAVPS